MMLCFADSLILLRRLFQQCSSGFSKLIAILKIHQSQISVLYSLFSHKSVGFTFPMSPIQGITVCDAVPQFETIKDRIHFEMPSRINFFAHFCLHFSFIKGNWFFVCISTFRCVAKYWEIHERVGKKLQTMSQPTDEALKKLAEETQTTPASSS